MCNDDQSTRPERRKYGRISYNPVERPRLEIIGREFEVVDISERGIRFKVQDLIELPKYVSGRLLFLGGVVLDVEGLLKWTQKNEYGMYLKEFIPAGIIKKEQQYILDHT